MASATANDIRLLGRKRVNRRGESDFSTTGAETSAPVDNRFDLLRSAARVELLLSSHADHERHSFNSRACKLISVDRWLRLIGARR
jgi:hypothetical protein